MDELALLRVDYPGWEIGFCGPDLMASSLESELIILARTPDELRSGMDAYELED